ncbi:MAG: response regulator [Spirochaetia bacterium]|nr:response regulator [Spirochaetia bacterium]
MKKILIVEDQAPVAKILTDILRKGGFEVHNATNGQVGIDLALEVKPDLILTDIMMPVKTGYELIQELRANPDFSSTPIYAISAKGGTKDAEAAVGIGATGFLPKPFSPGTVVEMIKKILDVK